MSLTNEEQQKQGSLAKVKLAVDTVFSAQVETARILGASDDALKAMNNTFKFKGGAYWVSLKLPLLLIKRGSGRY